MERLSDLPNIGNALEERLARVGIDNAEALRQAGSKEAFIKLHLLEGDTCYSSLCALEGAVRGKRWHYLDSETKAELKGFFDSFSVKGDKKLKHSEG
jgi:DNA transformation protein